MAENQRRPGRPPVLSECQRIEAILDAAERTFTESGYAATTMDRIAAAAQMSKRSLYLHFADKTEVLHGLLRRSSTEHVVLIRPEDEALDARGRIKAFLLRLAAFVMEPSQVSLFRLAISEPNSGSDVSRAFYYEVLGSTVGRVQRNLEEMAAAGLIRVTDAGQLAIILIGGAFGTSPMSQMMRATDEAEALSAIDARIDLMLDLLAPSLGLD